MEEHIAVMDGNEAIARVAHKVNEVIAIYTETQPFELGVVDGRKLAATGARDVTSHSSGSNLPVSGDR